MEYQFGPLWLEDHWARQTRAAQASGVVEMELSGKQSCAVVRIPWSRACMGGCNRTEITGRRGGPGGEGGKWGIWENGETVLV